MACVKILHDKKQFTDTSNFDLVCMVCGEGIKVFLSLSFFLGLPFSGGVRVFAVLVHKTSLLSLFVRACETTYHNVCVCMVCVCVCVGLGAEVCIGVCVCGIASSDSTRT